MLKSLCITFTHTKTAQAKLRGKYLMNFSWESKQKKIFCDSLKTQIQNLKKLANFFSRFNPFPSLPSAATEDSK